MRDLRQDSSEVPSAGWEPQVLSGGFHFPLIPSHPRSRWRQGSQVQQPSAVHQSPSAYCWERSSRGASFCADSVTGSGTRDRLPLPPCCVCAEKLPPCASTSSAPSAGVPSAPLSRVKAGRVVGGLKLISTYPAPKLPFSLAISPLRNKARCQL